MTTDIKALTGALRDKCECAYTDDDKYNDPAPPRHDCTQCRAALALEALAGEVVRLNKIVGDQAVNCRVLAEKCSCAATHEARAERLRVALETIAEEHDAGRHDGLPEPCPAHDADTMFYVARKALGDAS